MISRTSDLFALCQGCWDHPEDPQRWAVLSDYLLEQGEDELSRDVLEARGSAVKGLKSVLRSTDGNPRMVSGGFSVLSKVVYGDRSGWPRNTLQTIFSPTGRKAEQEQPL